ncbi:PaaX family transcriptional regulator C-terminal domain-containing protein, partial [Saccharothrix stipae]
HLDPTHHLNVFTAHTAKPTEADQIVHTAFDIPAIAHRYQAFLHRWDHHQPLPHAPDDLARQLLLHTEWLHLVRQDPRLPAQHLPHDWPAIRAQHLFHTLALAYQEPARTIAESVLDTIPVDGP